MIRILRTVKKLFNFMFSRLFMVGLMIAIQLALLVLIILYFSQAGVYYYLFFNIVSIIVVGFIVSNSENPSYKITWIIAIMLLPVSGGMFYLFFGNKRMPAKLRRQVDAALENTKNHMPDHPLGQLSDILVQDPSLGLQSQYIYNMSGYPVWENVGAEYFPLGEDFFERLKEQLRGAEHFIFLQFFIVAPGVMWDAVFDILKQKVAEGVEVRMMYDDLGSIRTLPAGYDRVIREAGIDLCVFNPFRPRASVILNYRDHRKICVVDGQCAFCGGINLADEYINAYEKHGHWKDTGVMIRGEGVWAFTFMFLQQWRFSTQKPVDFGRYHVHAEAGPTDGLVQVFGDSPLDRVNVTETAYLNIISRATRYVYIASPYLVIDHEMENALCAAAESGIDVRIITPHIYDKWYVHILTRSHYARLIRSGVRIYEYTPGFMHAKMFVSDDNLCMVGTCNMDFRSFYLHFECSVAFFHSDIVQRVKEDLLDCQQVCEQISLQQATDVALHTRLLRAVLKLFAPLM